MQAEAGEKEALEQLDLGTRAGRYLHCLATNIACISMCLIPHQNEEWGAWHTTMLDTGFDSDPSDRHAH